jgi:hypothetical protein
MPRRLSSMIARILPLQPFAAQTLLIRTVIGVSRVDMRVVTRHHYSESLT